MMDRCQPLYTYSLAVLLVIVCSACSDFVEIGPPKSKVGGNQIFENKVVATAAMEGIYHQMYLNGFASGDASSVSVICGLTADEFIPYQFVQSGSEFYQNRINTKNSTVLGLWSSLYSTIYQANAIIEGLEAGSRLTDDVKSQLLGEALFIRAFCYFYLTNLFGDVPLILSTSYEQNSISHKESLNTVYQQVLHDLLAAQDQLADDYVTPYRVRPNKFAAKAMLSRVYLFLGNWENAEIYASQVIDNVELYHLEELNNVFLAESAEAIWQLMPVAGGYTNEASISIITYQPLFISLVPSLVDAFDPNDQRLPNWVGVFDDGTSTYYYSYKYKVGYSPDKPTEFSIVLRLAEQYLIRAEARARLGKIAGASGAIADLNSIRVRASIGEFNDEDKDNTVKEVIHQRQIELFSEWGHRWLDLKRTMAADSVLGAYKEGWTINDELFPIPQSEMNKDPNLAPQNPGY